MPKLTKKVTNWLFTVLQPQYLNTEIAYRDIYRFLLVYLEQRFKIRTAVYTSALGSSYLLVNLYGPLVCGTETVQINIWVPFNYPIADNRRLNTDANGVPVIFIAPPNGYIIRPGNNVDSQGKVYHPFLAQWHNQTASGQPAGQFDLLLLLDCLKSTFGRESPVCVAPQVTGPALPPKPASNMASPPLSRVGLSSGPPLPVKVNSNQDVSAIPERYRAPPPLPGQVTPNQWERPETTLARQVQTEIPSAHIPLAPISGINHSWPTSENGPQLGNQVNPHNLGPTHNNKSPRRKPPPNRESLKGTGIEDLMDQVTLESQKDTPNPLEMQRIAKHLNLYLDNSNPEGVNGVLLSFNETRTKASSLHSLLSHHNNQASANLSNLELHVLYLTEQVDAARHLNQNLQDIAEANRRNPEDVVISTSPMRKVPLDDLVIPDLILVRQLYDTVAEIGGYKDAIKLIGGTYKSESELINDESLDSCIRSVRTLSRELFWLDVTKNKIGQEMGLQI